MIDRRAFLATFALSPLSSPAWAKPKSLWVAELIAAAEEQVGVTTIYDPAYVQMKFPGGDVPIERGVCTDVIIRAYRAAFGFDHQRAVNADMRRAFSAYPRRWGLKRPDPHIDHRRVENLRVFWTRKGAALPVPQSVGEWSPGDLVTQLLPGNLPHVGIVTASLDDVSGRPLIAHNIGAGVQVEDVLERFKITGRYRFGPELFAA